MFLCVGGGVGVWGSGRLNNYSESVHTLIFETCKCITLHVKKDFSDVIKLRILRRGEISWIIQAGPV